jgi:hypothetical protein
LYQAWDTVVSQFSRTKILQNLSKLKNDARRHESGLRTRWVLPEILNVKPDYSNAGQRGTAAARTEKTLHLLRVI